jgi:hypothetical protein
MGSSHSPHSDGAPQRRPTCEPEQHGRRLWYRRDCVAMIDARQRRDFDELDGIAQVLAQVRGPGPSNRPAENAHETRCTAVDIEELTEARIRTLRDPEIDLARSAPEPSIS